MVARVGFGGEKKQKITKLFRERARTSGKKIKKLEKIKYLALIFQTS